VVTGKGYVQQRAQQPPARNTQSRCDRRLISVDLIKKDRFCGLFFQIQEQRLCQMGALKVTAFFRSTTTERAYNPGASMLEGGYQFESNFDLFRD
jgi:hypothetical protein